MAIVNTITLNSLLILCGVRIVLMKRNHQTQHRSITRISINVNSEERNLTIITSRITIINNNNTVQLNEYQRKQKSIHQKLESNYEPKKVKKLNEYQCKEKSTQFDARVWNGRVI